MIFLKIALRIVMIIYQVHNTYCSKSFTYLIVSSQQTHASYFFYRHENGSWEKISYPWLVGKTLICRAFYLLPGLWPLQHRASLTRLPLSKWLSWARGNTVPWSNCWHCPTFQPFPLILGDYTSIFVTCSTNILFCPLQNTQLKIRIAS